MFLLREERLGILFAGFGIVRGNDGMNAAAYEKVRFDGHVTRLHRFDEIVQDLVRDHLMERAFVPVAPKIKLEAFEFHAEFIGYVGDTDRRKIRLPGLGTKAREFWALHLNRVIPAGIGVLEYLEFFRRL